MKQERVLRVIAVFLFAVSMGLYAGTQAQDDTVRVENVLSAVPVVDGLDDDPCWRDVRWQPIDQVWIPYGTAVDSSDYWGRYKVVWSSETNLLYFLIQVHDDIAVGGFIPGITAESHHYDIVEVFIDEDNSGGLHVFDGTGATATQYGTNAENAFAHHIYADFPEDGGVTTVCYVDDIAGTGWHDRRPVFNTQHLPEFALRRQGDQYTREFSLKVYDDTYDPADMEASRVLLIQGKVMGLSVAVCDNDDLHEEPKSRDKFFGSVWVPAAKYNNHWIDASDFGTAKLEGPVSSVPKEPQVIRTGFRCYPNPSSGLLNLSMQNSFRGDVSIAVFDILGREVLREEAYKPETGFRSSVRLNPLPRGVYFVALEVEDRRFIEKVTLTGPVF
ncbi:MAG TPA: T9SS type A sorting domain-containing protein [bacterium]|nr:T9SS type A sorting domain-containing protein [bacterium]